MCFWPNFRDFEGPLRDIFETHGFQHLNPFARKSSRVLEQKSADIVTGAGDNAPLVQNGADITEGDLGFNVTDNGAGVADNGAGVADNDAGVADSVARALGKFACLACKMPFR